MKTLNVIGCGHVGKTLSRLWAEHGVFDIGCVVNRSLASSRRAVEFVGSGRAVPSYGEIEKADLVMISAADEAIEGCCRQLCDTGILAQGSIVFHTSGSLPSKLLDSASAQGASIASIHPVKSFADPLSAVETFAGTYCALEGDVEACNVLGEALERLGATTFLLEPEFKTVYHAATVIVCNYLIALLETGLRCFEKAGLSRPTAMRVMDPLVRESTATLFDLGPAAALTGPIARGETSVVKRQCEAIADWDEAIERVYRSLGRITVEVAAAKGHAGAESLAAIEKLLGE